MNKNVITTISHGEYKDVLFNNKCLGIRQIGSKAKIIN